MAELGRALLSGPGVLAFKKMYTDTSVVDRVSKVFWQIIDEQHARGEAKGDHYAKPGSNDRVWNVQEKLALRDPEAFVDYYKNDFIALIATAWLPMSVCISKAKSSAVAPLGNIFISPFGVKT